MKIHKIDNRQHYIKEQIDRSSEKFLWCKVGIEDVLTYKKVFQKNDIKVRGPILCLGTRNGREIDLFRNIGLVLTSLSALAIIMLISFKF